MNTESISHPAKICIPLEQALREWKGAGCYQLKMDGVFTVRRVSDGILVGETVRGEFTAFDCVEYMGGDMRPYPLETRLQCRNTLCSRDGITTVATVNTNGAAYLQHVLANDFEGVVLKSSGSYYETMTACKRNQIHVCRVTSIGPGQSITVADAATGVARGCVPAGGGKCDRLRVGNIVRVECETIHDSGLFRGAKLCREYLLKA